MGVHSTVACTLLIAAAAAACAAAAAPNQLPQSWPKCRRRDTNLDICLQEAIQVVIPQLAPGVPELGLPPVEPLFFKDFFTFERRPGRISLYVKMSNLYTNGIFATKIHSVYSDLDNGVIDLHFTVPITVMNADMEIQGSILHEPVYPQKGNVNITIYDLTCVMVVSGDIVERYGASYLDINYLRGSIISIGGINIHGDPLDKNPQRSSNLNYLWNNNLLAGWPYIREALEERFSEGFRQMANSIFSKVPIKEIFLADDPAVRADTSSLWLYGR